jgi:hypothetical protein
LCASVSVSVQLKVDKRDARDELHALRLLVACAIFALEEACGRRQRAMLIISLLTTTHDRRYADWIDAGELPDGATTLVEAFRDPEGDGFERNRVNDESSNLKWESPEGLHLFDDELRERLQRAKKKVCVCLRACVCEGGGGVVQC